MSRFIQVKHALTVLAVQLALVARSPAVAAGFDKINDTVVNVNTILVTISVSVVSIAILWAGFKMIFQGARLTDVANVLVGGTLVGGAGAMAAYIVS
ncbi:conjugal transfer protein TrbC [Pelomonas sp. Root1217]|uniref:TrbC/VirB2 family protein n=1 Tax=Pelomonas sp. Root1217 TaxID=1736430 RepID=UPI000709FF8D|nr:TrbC/VirB2 family protein [Pelomonas sp. Root1217]KQV46968.1 conjugal transfer protein TrbC [Pelomonas sp. Root1217]